MPTASIVSFVRGRPSPEAAKTTKTTSEFVPPSLRLDGMPQGLHERYGALPILPRRPPSAEIACATLPLRRFRTVAKIAEPDAAFVPHFEIPR